MAGVAVTAASTSAGAQSSGTPEAFAGTAQAQALVLKLFGTKLTIGGTSAEADTTPQATASGAGIALITQTTSNATANTATPTASPAQACGLNLPVANILTLSLACSQSKASIANSSPAATATANIADLNVGLVNTVLSVLQPVITALEGLGNPLLSTVLTTVQSIVQPVLGTTLTQLLGGLGISMSQPVTSLVNALERATQLVTVHVGDSGSSVVTSSGAVTATSSAQGATIAVLPGIEVGGGPLLSITVGEAATTSTYDRTSGTSSATFSPAILSVTLLGATIPVGLGSPITLLAGTPLASTISLGAGSTTKTASGVTATADGVSLDLLQGLNGGISLALANAESAVGGNVAVAAATTTAPPTTAAPVVSIAPEPVTLATTGTSTPFLEIGFFLILAGYITRRTYRSRRIRRSPR